ncbi:hypothetical protein NQD34_004722 [Periophthalmus magnuspinnatus]|nr:hypothetical protein NQD34_004722 [Periophthalmus magnuspinnatus]
MHLPGVSVLFRAFKTSLRRLIRARKCHTDEYIRRFILENTEVGGDQSLTPEIRLRLFTPKCRFWKERPELWPFSDPFWAIYWPGGQAVSRYIMDNPEMCRGKAVLDLGSGCGASAIVAKKCGAKDVTANDIDTVAGLVTIMNSELNNLAPPVCSADNMISSEPEPFDLILLGDMFYDETLATDLHAWLDTCIKTHGATVLIGDPGRAAFEGHNIHHHLHHLAQYELPQSVREENYGLIYSSVWCYRPRL